MKNIFFLIFLLSAINTEANNESKFSIVGVTSGIFNGKEVTLSIVRGDSLSLLAVDTIRNASFTFEGDEYLENVAKIVLNDPEHDYSCEVFLEKGNIQVTLDSTSYIKGTLLNDLYATYLSGYRSRMAVAEKEYAANIQGKENPQTERFDSLQKECSSYMAKFQIDNINNAVGRYLYIKDVGRFWDPFFWETYELLPSDVKSHPVVVHYCSQRREMDQMQKAMEQEIGQKMKDIQLYTTDSCKVQLSDYLKGVPYLYIDIWASWCGPCIQELPKLKSIHDKYKDKGLKIVLVSIDEKFDSWIHAINRQAFDFDHLIDMTGGKALAQTFNFTIIPHGILLDREGHIISNNLWNVSLKKKLIELYGE